MAFQIDGIPDTVCTLSNALASFVTPLRLNDLKSMWRIKAYPQSFMADMGKGCYTEETRTQG